MAFDIAKDILNIIVGRLMHYPPDNADCDSESDVHELAFCSAAERDAVVRNVLNRQVWRKNELWRYLST